MDAPAKVRDGLHSLKQLLHDRFGERFIELRLFGSYARGIVHDESDVDALIVLEEPPSREEEDDVFRIIADVNIAHRMWISPLILSRRKFREMVDDELQIALDIEAEGIPV